MWTVAHLPVLLRAEALSVWEALPDSTKAGPWKSVKDASGVVTTKGLVDELAERFSIGEGAAEWRRRCQSRKQLEGESCARVAEDIDRWVDRGYVEKQGFNRDLRDVLKVDFFRAAIRPEIRRELLRKERPKNLRDALDQARLEEELVDEMRREKLMEVRVSQIDTLAKRVNQLEIRRRPAGDEGAIPQPPKRARWQPPFRGVNRPPGRGFNTNQRNFNSQNRPGPRLTGGNQFVQRPANFQPTIWSTI